MSDMSFEINLEDCNQWGKYGAVIDCSIFDENLSSGGGVQFTKVCKYFEI